MTEPIYHLATQWAWETARRAGLYAADTLSSEGFIHCSTADQWPRVREDRFAGRDDLVLLEIDPTRVQGQLRWEAGFPHLYGALEIEAVVSARRL
ncbi:MAG: DUF952 domain-containing protein [Chloroflexi bacterium]|nr:MAG: DUF952 domain-containing protein [Chloroflexota bacterium]